MSEINKLCCDRPRIDWAWKLGLDEQDEAVLLIEQVHCSACGAIYTFDDQGEVRCPVIQYSEGDVVLAVRFAVRVH